MDKNIGEALHHLSTAVMWLLENELTGSQRRHSLSLSPSQTHFYPRRSKFTRERGKKIFFHNLMSFLSPLSFFLGPLASSFYTRENPFLFLFLRPSNPLPFPYFFSPPCQTSSLFLDFKSISVVQGGQQQQGKGGRTEGRKVWLSHLLSVCPISAKDLSLQVYYCLLALFYHPWTLHLSSEPCKVSPLPFTHSLSHFLHSLQHHPPFFQMLKRQAVICR